MAKTIRVTDCLVVVLSSLMVGCAGSLPELPLDAPYSPGPVQEAASFTPGPIVPLRTPDPVLSGEVIFEEAIVDNIGEIYPDATIENLIPATEDTGVVNSGIDMPLVFIANDLVRALSFIGGMNPNVTSISSPASASEFDMMVKNSMLRQGYRFNDRRVRGNQQLTTSFLEVERSSQVSELTAIMALNSVLIKRTYFINNDVVEPGTSYIIRGIDPELVDLNDQIRIL